MPKLPNPLEGFPRPPKLFSFPGNANPLREAIEDAREVVRGAKEGISEIASAIRVEGEHPTTSPKPETVATACVPCALGHFSTTAGLLNEAVRFKAEGITSNEVLDRIAKSLQEQNTLERVDLTQEKIRSAPDWERDIAEEALSQSRSLRHNLENLTSIEQLEQAAADTEGYYRSLNREWWKRRLAKTGETKPEMTLDGAKKMAASEAAKEVEERWQSQAKKSAT